MNISRSPWPAAFLVIGLVSGLLSACVVSDGGYGYDGGAGIGMDYYEPYGAVYGGWAPGYHVGPVRDGDHRPDHGGGQSATHAFRSAPTSHSLPSIPSGSRSGGGRSGGGRSGGGRSR